MVEQEWHGQFDEIGDSILMIEMNWQLQVYLMKSSIIRFKARICETIEKAIIM